MSTENLKKYIEARLEKNLPQLKLSEINAICDYDEWLDTRSPTLREADGDTCPYCSGSGTFHSKVDGKFYDCIHCKGSGHV